MHLSDWPGVAVQAQGPAAATTGYLPSADLGLNKLIFLSLGARVGLNSQTQRRCAGDGNCEVVFSCGLSGHSLKIRSVVVDQIH